MCLKKINVWYFLVLGHKGNGKDKKDVDMLE